MFDSGCLCLECKYDKQRPIGDKIAWCDKLAFWHPDNFGCTAGAPRPDVPRRYTVVVEVPEYGEYEGELFCRKACPVYHSCKWKQVKHDATEAYSVPGPGCPRYEAQGEVKS